MFEKWISVDLAVIPFVLVSTIATYAVILLYTRIVGLRSFSKMSAADFAMTVAVGSLFGSTISSPSPSLMLGITAIGCLFLGQWLIAVLRQRSATFSSAVDNQPLLLMKGHEMIEANLRKANVTREDVFAKLREANALNYDQVLAVVFESTGDISVLHSNESAVLEPDFMSGVIGYRDH
tara:strand:- start:77 stop:613 length:537 start_codon:yes stop_codon:yes gene_type:complete